MAHLAGAGEAPLPGTAPRRVAVLIRPECIDVLPAGVEPASAAGRFAVLKVAPIRDSFHGALRRVQVAVLGQWFTGIGGATRLVPPDPDLEAPPALDIETRDRRPFERIAIPAAAVQTLQEGAPA